MKRLFSILFLCSFSISVAQSDFMLAENYYRQGDYEKAVQLFEVIVKKSPFNTFYLKRLLTCYQESGQFEKAHTYLETTLNKRPSFYYLWVEVGYNYEKQQRFDEAKKHYDRALNNILFNPSLGGMTGRFFRDNNLLGYALKAYQKSMELNKNANYSFQIAQIYGEQGKFNLMFDSYVNMVDRNENYLSTVQRYASKYITEDPKNPSNIAFKRALLKKSVSRPKDVWNVLLSWLFTNQKEYSKAFIQEKALFRRNPEYLETLQNLGETAFRNNDHTAARLCFQFVLENSISLAEKINAELFLIRIAVAKNDATVENKFNVVFNSYGVNLNTLSIQLLYADYLTFKKNEPKKAEQTLEKAISFAKNKFEKARIKLKLGEILVFTNRFNKALIYFSQVQTQLKNHPLAQEARFKVAQTSYFKGDFTWASAQLKILKGSTTQLIANDAVELFLVISENIPQDSIPTGLKQFAKADLLAFQNKNKEAIALYTNVLKTYQGQNIEDNTLFKLAKAYTKSQQFNEAINTLNKLISTNTESPFIDDSYFALAELYHFQIKDPQKASEYYQKIIFEQPSSIHLVAARKRFRELRGDTIK